MLNVLASMVCGMLVWVNSEYNGFSFIKHTYTSVSAVC